MQKRTLWKLKGQASWLVGHRFCWGTGPSGSEGRSKREGNEVEGDKTAQGKDLGLWLRPG